MPKTKIKFTESFIFVSIWFLFYLSPIIANNNSDGVDWKPILFTWMIFLPFLIASFVNHYVLFPILFHKRKVLYFGVTALLLVGLALTSGRMHRSINAPAMDQERLFNVGPDRRPFPPPEHRFNDESDAGPLSENRPRPFSRRPGDLPPFVNTLFIGLLVIGFDIGLRTTFQWSKNEQEKATLEKEKVKSELAFLKNQLSPHFFMNTLNNIHSLIDIDTEEAKESIIRLSRLMRHLLYESEEDRILLSKEVNFIQSYVELMKLRFTDKVKVTFTVDSDTSKIFVPPLLFTSLIENAFKYGVSYMHESFIHIALKTSKSHLFFTISNSKSENVQKKDVEASGIGLENTRKRMELLYASNYEMNIDETATTFSVDLKLPI